MAKTNLTYLKKILLGINKSKKKYLTCESLSKEIGIYPDLIAENLSIFNPLIMMDVDCDIRTLTKDIEEYVNKKENKKEKREERKIRQNKALDQYESIADFVYQKFTVGGGIVDRNTYLSNQDLSILKGLVVEEIAARKPKKNKRR